MSPSAYSGALICSLTIGSSTIGEALVTASQKALRPAVAKAISFESTECALPS